MDPPRSPLPPLVLPAGLFAGGMGLAGALAPAPPWLVALLAVAGLAWGRRPGPLLVALAAGLLSGWLGWREPASWPEGLDLARPVAASVRLVGHPTSREEEQICLARLVVLRADREVRQPDEDVLLILPQGSAPRLGETLRVRGYLARSSLPANPGVPQDPGGWRLKVKSWQLVAVEAPPGPLARLSARLRDRLGRALEARSPGVDFARAMVLGDTSRLPEPLRRGLRRTGLAHVLSVSGMHLALVVAGVALATRVAGRLASGLAVGAATLLYVLAVGPLPALLRSAVMALVALVALGTRRPPLAAHGLALALLGLLLWRPMLIADLGFELSVAATAGLVLLAGPLSARWSQPGGWRLPPVLGRPLAATVAAQLASQPFSLPVFALLCPLAPLFNLLAVPWTGLVLIASFVWTAAALAWPAAALACAPALDALVAPLGWAALLPAASWWLWPLAVGPVTAVAISVLGLAACWWPRRSLVPAALALLGVMVVAAVRAPVDPQLVMLDVGQGDAILLRDGRAAALIDGGGWPGGDLGLRVLVPALAELGVRHLDLAIATHGDRDHCGGLVDITGYLPVDRLMVGPDWEAAACTRSLAAVAAQPFGPAFEVAGRGTRLSVGRWRLEVLAPAPGDAGPENERSLVLRASVGTRGALLMGDAGVPAEDRLRGRSRAEDLDVDLLKVGHHGSRSASGPAFLAATSPRLALVSAGRRNAYGHPAPDVLAGLERAGARILRTDRSGAIRITLENGGDGGLRIETPCVPVGAPCPRW